MIAARFLVLLALMVAPLAAEAQPATKPSRIGYLSPTFASEPDNRRRLGALREGLRDLGYVEGQNIIFETDGPRVSTAGSRIWRPSWSTSRWT